MSQQISAMKLSRGVVGDAHKVFSAALGWMREVLSPPQAANLAGSRGLWLGTVAVGPSARQHRPLAATSMCCTRATAKPPLSYCRAIAKPLPLGHVQPGLGCSLHSLACK